MKELVSIIIPVYNRQDVLRECIESVQAQSYQNFEIVLIDDGSTDQTLEFCHKLADQDARIVLLASNHAGVSAARNKGLDIARGEYVFFLDSDDVIHPMLLEDLVNGIQSTDAAIAGTKRLDVSEKYWNRVQERITQDCGPGDVTYHNHEDTLSAVFHTMTPLNIIGGVMMEKDLIGNTRFRTDLHIGEDYYFVYQNLVKGSGAVFLKQKRYYARLHANNLSWDYSYAGFWSRFYRRQLVWENEELLGRKEYANCQKREGLGVFLRCFVRNAMSSEDNKKMRRTMKAYRTILLPALSSRDKVRFFLSVYVPVVYLPLYHMKQELKKLYYRLKSRG